MKPHEKPAIFYDSLRKTQTPDELRRCWRVCRAIHQAFGGEWPATELVFKRRAADLGLKWKKAK